METKNIEEPIRDEQKKLVQDDFNVNVAFYIHLKSFNDTVRDELQTRIKEVFFFSKGIHWKFDSFGIEKPGSRGTEVLGYFGALIIGMARAACVHKLPEAEIFIMYFCMAGMLIFKPKGLFEGSQARKI